MTEHKIDIACVSEPASIPHDSRWIASTDKLSAVVIGPTYLQGRCIPISSNNNFVVVKCDWFYVVSVYISPNVDRGDVQVALDGLGDVVRGVGGRCIICGDFNAKSILWGSPVTDWRGSVVERWAAGSDLYIVNVGSTPTCVRYNGSSVVDLTWASADVLGSLSGWQVLSDAVSLSDHRYIAFRMGGSRLGHVTRGVRFPRWNIKTLDRELFREALDLFCTVGLSSDAVDDFAVKIARLVSAACDVAAKRLGPHGSRRGVYWWSDELAQARRRCVAARRLYSKAKRRNRPHEDFWNLHKKARSDFARKIRKAKSEAWGAFLRTLDDDPWGIPYKIVMDRLRTTGPSLFDSLRPMLIERLLDDLFPAGETHDPEELWRDFVPDLECRVTCEEVQNAIRSRRKGGCPAPGPDGLSLTVWRCAPRRMVEALASLFTLCLESGRIPAAWKRAILVLIPKGQLDVNSPKARPICLLNDVGKFFERILDRRIKNFKASLRPGDKPARILRTGMQFGFTEGVSTVDALDAVIGSIKRKLGKGLVVIAVSLDIKNAFNSVSWESIRWAMERDGYPAYLRRILDSYLHERFIDYPTRSGGFTSREVVRGVPQGSVLGPLLWNIAYGYVLRLGSSTTGVSQCVLVGYADDTLVLCHGDSVEVAQSRVNTVMPYLLNRMSRLSLDVAADKTEAVLFRGRRRLDFVDPLLRVGSAMIPTRPSMKYLGIMMDCRLNFRQHFTYIGAKIGKVTRALGRLLPNLRGPHENKRRLYAHVIASVVVYAAPVWAPASANSVVRARMRRWQRTIALRTCAAYRSVSWDSATVLSRLVPFELLAMERYRIYTRWQDAKDVGAATPEALSDIKIDERIVTQRQWVLLLSRPGAAGLRLRDALLPHLGRWMTRSWGGLTFRITALLPNCLPDMAVLVRI